MYVCMYVCMHYVCSYGRRKWQILKLIMNHALVSDDYGFTVENELNLFSDTSICSPLGFVPTSWRNGDTILRSARRGLLREPKSCVVIWLLRYCDEILWSKLNIVVYGAILHMGGKIPLIIYVRRNSCVRLQSREENGLGGVMFSVSFKLWSKVNSEL